MGLHIANVIGIFLRKIKEKILKYKKLNNIGEMKKVSKTFLEKKNKHSRVYH